MDQTSTKSKQKKILLISIALYIAACALPALLLHNLMYLDSKHSVWGAYRTVRGIDLLVQGLVLGWLRFNFTAFANLPLWVSWFQFARGNYRSAGKWSIAALMISIETLQLTIQPYTYDEAATVKGFLVAPHVGFCCWIASMALICFQSNLCLHNEQSGAGGGSAPL